jgi:hypothetical protein
MGILGKWPESHPAKIPHSDKTSCALGAPPSMKMGAAPYRAVNGLFSVGVEAIFIAADFSGTIEQLRNPHGQIVGRPMR